MSLDACAEEQALEIEALTSILMDDLTPIPEGSGDGIPNAPGACYQIEIRAYGDNDSVPEDADDADDAVLGLVFAHTARYPEEAPEVKCRSVRGLRDGELAEIQRRVVAQCDGLLGQAMIFDLVQTCKEWMRARVGATDFVDEETEDELRARLEAEAEERLRQMRLVGTPVTEENFKAWQRAYMEEMGETLSAAREREDGRVTGRRYFETRSAKELQDDMDAREDDRDEDFSDDEDDEFSSDEDEEDEDDDA